jgi:hypothetical protein
VLARGIQYQSPVFFQTSHPKRTCDYQKYKPPFGEIPHKIIIVLKWFEVLKNKAPN